jgi:SNF2 family DNA or RNA helicase
VIFDMLYPYQREAAERIIAQRRLALLHDPGLGKTITTLGAAEADGLLTTAGSRTLVLATKTGAALTWEPTADRLTPRDTNVLPAHSGGLPKRRKDLEALLHDDAPLLVVANHAFLETQDFRAPEGPLFTVPWDMVVVDESHRVLPTTEVSDFRRTRFWQGLLALQYTPRAIRLPLTGTPDRGKLNNRYGTYKFLFPENFNVKELHYEKWLLENFYVGFKKFKVGRHTVEQMYPTRLKNEHKWITFEQAVTDRKTKREVYSQMPDKQYHDILLRRSAKLHKAYNKYLDDFKKEDDGSADAADTFRIRATQFAICEWDIVQAGRGTRGTPRPRSDSPKRDWIIDWLSDHGFDSGPDQDNKVVITSQFASVLRWLQDELALSGFASELLVGDQSTPQRLAVQNRFQTDPGSRILLLSMSLGDSIDLDAADDMIFIDLVNDPDKTTQTEDRIHRVSRVHNVTIWRLRMLQTVDMAIATHNDDTYEMTRALMDGSRGVEYERKIIERLQEREAA